MGLHSEEPHVLILSKSVRAVLLLQQPREVSMAKRSQGLPRKSLKIHPNGRPFPLDAQDGDSTKSHPPALQNAWQKGTRLGFTDHPWRTLEKADLIMKKLDLNIKANENNLGSAQEGNTYDHPEYRLSLEMLKQGLEDICQLFCRWDLCTGRWWNRQRALS